MPRARLVFDGDGVYTEKEARIHKLTQETETKIDNIPGVVDDVNSTSTTDALSANMGKRLQDQINQLTGLNKFLSTWDCTTGLPVTDPSATPFTYASGNYYLVATVAGEGGTNYKPHGSTFTPGVASTAVETNEVNVNDMYIFDGSQWILQVNKVKEIIVDDGLDPESTNAVENRAIYLALTTKQDKILDLADIRAGAALGMTSVQPGDNITELTNNVGYQTAGDVAVAIENALEEFAPEGVGTGVLTLQKNSTTLDTFSANAIQNKTINIPVPTTVAELSDASDYVTDTELSTTLEDYATKDYVDGNVIHSGPTAPDNPEEGMLWYDTTNNVLKVYNGNGWDIVDVNLKGDVNTKTFFISGMDDLTNAQALVDWVSGGNDRSALIHLYTGKIYTLISTGTKRGFIQLSPSISNNNGGYSYSKNSKIIFNIENGIVASITSEYITVSPNVLATDYDYQTPYTPQYDGSPATKKYVDDTVTSATEGSKYVGPFAPRNPDQGMLWYDTVGNVLKVYNGSEWVVIAASSIVSDTAFGSSWDGDTTHAPSKNAIYDVLGDVETLLANL